MFELVETLESEGVLTRGVRHCFVLHFILNPGCVSFEFKYRLCAETLPIAVIWIGVINPTRELLKLKDMDRSELGDLSTISQLNETDSVSDYFEFLFGEEKAEVGCKKEPRMTKEAKVSKILKAISKNPGKGEKAEIEDHLNNWLKKYLKPKVQPPPQK